MQARPFQSRRLMVRALLPFLGVTLAALAALAPSAANAQQYPDRSIRIVVPFPAGGTVDVATRAVGERLAEVLGQPIVIDNRPGGNGTIGAHIVAKAQPDGHTLLAVSSSHVINPSTMASMSFDPIADFSPITILGTLPLVIVTGLEQPFKSLPEMIAYAKSRPGSLSIGYTDASTMLFGEMLKSEAGLDIRQVPYKGGAPMLVDVMGGHIELGATGAGSAHSHHKAGKIRVLAVSEQKRAPSMPEIPTIAESGIPGFNVQVWIALMGPAGMPSAVVDRLNSEIAKVISEPVLNARLTELGTIPRGSSPADALTTLRADAQMWSAAAKKAGLKPQ